MRRVAYQKIFGINELDTINRALLVKSGATHIFEDTNGEALDIYIDIFGKEMLLKRKNLANMCLNTLTAHDDVESIIENRELVLSKLKDADINVSDTMYHDVLDEATRLLNIAKAMTEFSRVKDNIKTIE